MGCGIRAMNPDAAILAHQYREVINPQLSMGKRPKNANTITGGQ
jgi:hypothetical protein